MKIYSSDFKLDNKDVDRTGFKYETFVKSESFNPPELFGGVSITYTLRFQLQEEPASLDQVKSILITYFYGSGEKVSAQMKLSVKSK